MSVERFQDEVIERYGLSEPQHVQRHLGGDLRQPLHQEVRRVLASQSEVALDRSETFLRNQDPTRTSANRHSITSSARASTVSGM